MKNLLALISLLGIALTLTSCGGSHGLNASSQATGGKASMTIKWPARNSRIIPTAANSIAITVSMAGKTIATSGPIARPAKGGNSTWSTPALPSGTYLVSAKALPNADGTGTPQAAGASTLTIVPNKNTQASVTMGSTVASVQMSTTSLLARPGFTFNVSATAFDAQGNMVLVADSALTWKISNPSALSMVKGGVDAQFKGVGNGNSSVTCTFTEVDPSLGQTPVSSPAASCLTSTPGSGGSGWGAYVCNVQGTATSPAPPSDGRETDLTVPTNFALGGILADGSLTGSFINTAGNPLVMLNADGSVRWTFIPTTDDHGGYGRAFASDGSLYISEANDIRVLNPADGSTIATYPCADASFVLGNDGTIFWTQFYSAGEHPLYAMKPDGTPLWTSTFTPQGIPAIGPDGTLYLSASFGVLDKDDWGEIALDPSTGVIKWRYTTVGYAFAQAAVSRSIVFLQPVDNANPQCPLTILDAHTGLPLSTYVINNTTPTGSESVCIDSNNNVMLLDTMSWSDEPWQATKMNIDGGSPWIGPLSTGGPGSQITSADNGNIYYMATQTAKSTAVLNAYDASGNILWGSAPITTPPILGGWNDWPVPMIGSDGTVYFQPSDGAPIMKFAPAASPSTARKSTSMR